jgi:hypothetical protein
MNDLSKIQSQVKAPKGQFNNFGKYKYRSCEDIVEAVKPVINSMGYYLTLSDTIECIGNRFYIKATATLSNGEKEFSATAYAREDESKKGMDGSQVTGAASSYARKYALNGLFAIDDTKDSDATNHGETNGANVSEIFAFSYTSSLQENLLQMLERSTFEDKAWKSIQMNINDVAGMTEEKYNKIKTNLEANQQEPIASGMPYNQSDIKKKMKTVV